MNPSDYLEEAIDNLTIDYNLNILNAFKLLLPEDLNSKIESLISDINYVNCRNCLNKNVLLSLNSIARKIPISMSYDYDNYLNAIYENLSTEFGDSAVNAIDKTITKLNNNNRLLRELLSEIEAYFTSQEFLKQLFYMKATRRMLNTSKKGFNFYVSDDGVNFTEITDKFNYGIRTFVSSDDGLYIGTANPFYGAQLWKLILAPEFHC